MMMCAKRLINSKRLGFSNVYSRIRSGSLLVGMGYCLSADDPLSYFPYGCYYSFEKASELFPSLKVFRLSVLIMTSKAAEHCSIESSFLNGYLLKRLCEEAADPPHQLAPTICEGSSISPLMTTKTNSLDEAKTSNPLLNHTKVPSLVWFMTVVLSSFTDLCSYASRVAQPISPLCWMEHLHASVLPRFRPVYLKPSTAMVVERLWHLTCTLDPQSEDVHQLVSIYLYITHFLNVMATQNNFSEEIKELTGLERQRCLLRLLHLALLATYRVEYWKNYETKVVIPEPPETLASVCGSKLPLFSKRHHNTSRKRNHWVLLPFSSTVERTPERTEVYMKGPSCLVRRDTPHGWNGSTCTIGTWDAHDLADNCLEKLTFFWKNVCCCAALRRTVKQTVWEDLCHQYSYGAEQHEPIVKSPALYATQDAAHWRKLVQECEALQGIVRVLCRKFPTKHQYSYARYVHEALGTPGVVFSLKDLWRPWFLFDYCKGRLFSEVGASFWLGMGSAWIAYFLLTSTENQHPCRESSLKCLTKVLNNAVHGANQRPSVRLTPSAALPSLRETVHNKTGVWPRPRAPNSELLQLHELVPNACVSPHSLCTVH